LYDGWTVRAVGGDIPDGMVRAAIPATVPGCVHLDLMAAGLVPDPYVGEDECESADLVG
jgi:beta-mannosidase